MTFSRATSRSEEPMRASLFSRLLGALTLVLMMLTTATAWALDGITYIDENGEGQTANGVTVLSNGSTTLGAGWYVVSGTETDTKITIKGTVTLVGDVNIILADGATMNVGTSSNRISGFGIDGDSNLTIYGQSGGTGALNVYTTGAENHTIHAEYITISGGHVNATNDVGYAIYADGNLTITGGNVTANGNICGIYVTGAITLGWTRATDRITANSYDGNLAIASGKAFIDKGGTLHTATNVGTLAGKTLYPYIENLDLEANAHEGNYWTTFYCGHTGYKIDDGENAWAYTATLSISDCTEINLPVPVAID